MSFDLSGVIAVMMVLGALMSARGRRGKAWRSGYAVIALSILHLGFLYQFFGTGVGRLSSEAWAAITAAGVAGIATDDDADAVGLLLAVLGIFQILLLAGVLNLRPA